VFVITVNHRPQLNFITCPSHRIGKCTVLYEKLSVYFLLYKVAGLCRFINKLSQPPPPPPLLHLPSAVMHREPDNDNLAILSDTYTSPWSPLRCLILFASNIFKVPKRLQHVWLYGKIVANASKTRCRINKKDRLQSQKFN
jgi:hypothetical protein